MSAAEGLARSLVCPSCRAPLDVGGRGVEDVLRCSVEDKSYARESGIWRLLDVSASSEMAEFLTQYRAVRRNEGWGSADDRYYRELPFRDTSDRHEEIWNIRAVTHRLFIRRVMGPLEAERRRQRILDLGAGNCWLSHRLARRGHEVAAVDINDDPADGLGAHVHYDREARFEPVQSSFDRLPWADHAVDLAIYNGSLHYSSDYVGTLGEALRVLVPGGRVVILDSPFYRREASGEAMVREREEALGVEYGADDSNLGNEGFLTQGRLDTLGFDLGLEWRVLHAHHGIRAALRPLKNRFMGRREQARFPVIIGRRPPARRAAAALSGQRGRRRDR